MILFRRFFLVILTIELLVFLTPYLIPSAWYYNLYLGDQSLAIQKNFYKGSTPSLADELTGWKNTPNFSKKEWVIDQWGSRSHKPIALEKTPGVPRVLFVGNSLINGGNIVNAQGTISRRFNQAAKKDGKTIEVMNFATMAYNPGQSYLQLKAYLLKFKPDHIVFGLSETAHAGLSNLFLPFYLTEERNMPYVKPGFFNDNGSLKTILPPHELAQGTPQKLLDFLEQHDQHYFEFYRFQHFDLSPILWSLDQFARKVNNFKNYLIFEPQKFDILNMILAEVQALSKEEGFDVTYVYIPTPRAFRTSIIWRNLPDYYAKGLDAISQPNEFNPEGLPVVDLREVLQKTDAALSDIYYDDMYHFSKKGNQLIGEGIYQAIGGSLNSSLNKSPE